MREKPSMEPADDSRDAVDVVMEVQASFVVTVGLYAGVPDKQTLAGLIGAQLGVHFHVDYIDGAKIIEVRVNDQTAAENIDGE